MYAPTSPASTPAPDTSESLLLRFAFAGEAIVLIRSDPSVTEYWAETKTRAASELTARVSVVTGDFGEGQLPKSVPVVI